MDYSFIAEYAPLYLEAALLTIKIAASGILGAFVVGIVCCLIRELKIPVLAALVQI